MKLKVVLANDMANELFGTEDDPKTSANFSRYFELYFPDGKTIFPIQNLPVERALAGEATDDVDVVIWNLKLQQKKRVLLSGRPIMDKKQGNCSGNNHEWHHQKPKVGGGN